MKSGIGFKITFRALNNFVELLPEMFNPLTKERSKPAVPLGGKYRLVDIPVSNCINSGIKKIFVITQFNSESLNRSVYETYKFDHFSHGYIRILAAEQSMENKEWLQGTADAIRKNIRHISADMNVEYCLILSGDQLYKMDYNLIISRHKESRADVTNIRSRVRMLPLH